ncbi:Kelch repeat-containing protein [Nocardia sp. NPDC006044]|uniref:Kelch repeat-containing protein n=1 Tax=Nocardia sp. NPDC006044 TaxID=3364306 RepID=UPI00369CCB62
MTALDSPPVRTAVWSYASDLPEGSRAFENDYALVALDGGAALLAGGADATFAAVAATALFDPVTTSWSASTPMTLGRRLHSVTRLADGTVLVAGGISGPYRQPFDILAAAERFDPKTKKWTPTRTSMTVPRSMHSATLLPDGRVLVAGGVKPRVGTNDVGSVNSAELYDPRTDTWAPTEPMADERTSHQAVLLADGRVLVVGGGAVLGHEDVAPTAFCEIFDPATGKWSATGSLAIPRLSHRAVLLPDGSVLALGGAAHGWVPGPVYDTHSLNTTERWYPVTDRWAPAARMPFGRDRFHAITMKSGKVLVFGGGDEQYLFAKFLATSLYDPYADTWSAVGPMSYGRMDFAATLLTDGRVLAAGGSGGDDLPASTEIYTP